MMIHHCQNVLLEKEQDMTEAKPTVVKEERPVAHPSEPNARVRLTEEEQEALWARSLKFFETMKNETRQHAKI